MLDEFPSDTFGSAVRQLIAGESQIREKWRELFGSQLANTWAEPATARGHLLQAANTWMNQGTRIGHMSFFYRESISDRLLLEYSTQDALMHHPSTSYVKNQRKNLDPTRGIPVYQLHDRLRPSKVLANAEECIAARGFTGWVAVTGYPLCTNGDRSFRPDLFSEAGPRIIDEFGRPKWSGSVREFASDTNADASEKEQFRILCVPVWDLRRWDRRAHNVMKPIGVLRYSCRSQYGPDLREADSSYVESIAEMLSLLFHLEKFKPVARRADRLDLEIQRFRENGDIKEFLKFVAESTKSKISSLYVDIKVNGATKLRLFDAFGISGEVGQHRSVLKDYSANETGITYKLFEGESFGQSGPIKVLTSVASTNGWKGINTGVFYSEHFKRLGIMPEPGQHASEMNREVIERYAIPLMGQQLVSSNGSPIGVLKVEFADTGEPSSYYEEEDRKFFSDCAGRLREEIEIYREFLSGRWFAHAGSDNISMFARLFYQVIRTRIISEDECKREFWQPLNIYFSQHKAQAEVAFAELFKKLNVDPTELRDRLSQSHITVALPEGFTGHLTVAVIAKAVVEGISRLLQAIL